MAADGSITIDTKLDTKGLNQGVDEVTNAATEAGKTVTDNAADLGGGLSVVETIVAAIGTGMTIVGTIILGVVIIAALLVGIFINILKTIVTMSVAIAKFGIELVNQMFGAMKGTGDYYFEVAKIKSAFMDVQSAVYAAFSPIVTFALPYIIQFCNWLVTVLNTIAMITAALLHQKTVQQEIVNSANALAEAAQGALAAFDKLNVLQPTNPGAGDFKSVPVDPEVLAKTWEGIKKWWNEVALPWLIDKWNWVWTKVTDFAASIWQKLVAWFMNTLWLPVTNWFNTHIITPLLTFFSNLWTSVSTWATNSWNTIAKVFGTAWNWLVVHFIGPVGADFNSLFATISVWVQDWWLVVSTIFGAVWNFIYTNVILPVWNGFMWLNTKLNEIVLAIWNGIVSVYTPMEAWWKQHVTDPVISAFDGMSSHITGIFKGLWEGIGIIVKGAINLIISNINFMMTAIQMAINFIVGGLNNVGQFTPGWKVIPPVNFGPIPYLATGAVIPPNAAYLAVVGDQKNGTNIEAPADLIRSIMSEEIAKNQANIKISFNGSLAGLARYMKPAIDQENIRTGNSLVKRTGQVQL